MPVRAALPADLPALVALEAAAFGSQAWSEQAVRDELVPTRRVLVTDVPPVVAWASVLVAGETADLTRIAVLPENRRRGVARVLLAACLDAARADGAERLLLEVDAANGPAARLYASAGLAAVAMRRGYYAGGADALVMECAL